ncbi:3-keto-5-aminohexanoate cleavage protein [Rhodococcus sp. SRB_17]|nr:3-keto-5-aminohexanoate cleavage protein [Rhodococcus sp. SRB_17]
MSDKAILTCAITGVLTDPAQHHVPVTPEQLAHEARRAVDAGAAVVHVHFRQQSAGRGHLPSWDPQLALDCTQAMREACPGLIVNQSTGVVGPHTRGPIDCLRATRPEMAACNAGSLNYLKVRSNGAWAWPPMLFDNPPAKVQDFLDAMAETGTLPEFECFDVGIVRCVEMYVQTGMYRGLPAYNFVMGVASGMPADPDLLPILLKLKIQDAPWQATVIGRAEIWPVHRRVAELGGHLRSGLEDTFYLPDGTQVQSNAPLIAQLAQCAREAGRAVATPQEARQMLGLAPQHTGQAGA